MDNFRRRVEGERQKTVISTYLTIHAFEFTFDFEFNVPYQINPDSTWLAVGDIFLVSAPSYLLQKCVMYDDYSTEVIDEQFVNSTAHYIYDGLRISYTLIGGSNPLVDAELSNYYMHFDEDTINYAKSVFPGVDEITTDNELNWRSDNSNTGRQILRLEDYYVTITPPVLLVFDRQTDTIWFLATNT